jgi:MFS family permease
MYIGGVVGIIVILLAILIMVGVIGLSNLVVGGLFLALGVGLFGPFFDRYGRRAV